MPLAEQALEVVQEAEPRNEQSEIPLSRLSPPDMISQPLPHETSSLPRHNDSKLTLNAANLKALDGDHTSIAITNEAESKRRGGFMIEDTAVRSKDFTTPSSYLRAYL